MVPCVAPSPPKPDRWKGHTFPERRVVPAGLLTLPWSLLRATALLSESLFRVKKKKNHPGSNQCAAKAQVRHKVFFLHDPASQHFFPRDVPLQLSVKVDVTWGTVKEGI